jgi:hypothetical protein
MAAMTKMAFIEGGDPKAGAYTRPLFGSTSALPVGHGVHLVVV